jgi:hypothetical protein
MPDSDLVVDNYPTTMPDVNRRILHILFVIQSERVRYLKNEKLDIYRVIC